MKIRIKIIVNLLWLAMISVGCSRLSPTQSSSVNPLQQQYISLTATLMNEVEFVRGKKIKRAIDVSVTTKSQYLASMANQNNATSIADKNRSNAVWRCEGLLKPNQDFYAGYDTMMATSTGGFYEDGSNLINVIIDDNATAIPQDDSVTIFHELVHGMQDQYYNLTNLQDNVNSSDEGNALRYVLEGEAEMLGTEFLYKIEAGHYPTSFTSIIRYFNAVALSVDSMLDSLHGFNKPLLAQQPLYWAYYSYGPLFIYDNTSADWSQIDSKVFAWLPQKTFEVLHPEKYAAYSERFLDMSSFADRLNSIDTVYDYDELGEVLTCVMFREWDFSNYRDIADGIVADRIIAYTGNNSVRLRLIWNTEWSDSTNANDFLTNYALLVNKKRSLALPLPQSVDARVVILDTVSRVCLEQNGNRVMVLEDYIPAELDTLRTQLRNVSDIARTKSLAKTARTAAAVPWIDKSKLIKDIDKNRF